MFPVSLDCPFLISPSVFSNVYSDKNYLHIPEGVLLECNTPLYKDDNQYMSIKTLNETKVEWNVVNL
jgi:hypothetical protein